MTTFAQLLRPDGSVVYIAPSLVTDVVEPTANDMPSALAAADLARYAKVYMGGHYHVVEGTVASVGDVLDGCR